MPTIQVVLSDVKQRKGSNNILFVATANNGNQIVREIDSSQIDTWQSFAEWMLAQESEFVLLPDKEKSLSITFHTETLIDEFGNPYSVRIVDDVIVL